MKTLTLLRHAKSDWQSGAASDFERPLNARGQKGARLVGRALRAEELRFDAVIASPAARVVETLDAVAEAYGQPLRPRFDERIYLASAATLLNLVREADDGAERLLLVGHNPGLENLAMLLTEADGDGLRAELSKKYPTGALAEIALPAEHWRDVAPGSGELARFIRPRDLDPELGPEKED